MSFIYIIKHPVVKCKELMDQIDYQFYKIHVIVSGD